MPVTDAVVIGDGLVTDIAAANAVGARSVLVLTGVSTAEQAQALPSGQGPRSSPRDPPTWLPCSIAWRPPSQRRRWGRVLGEPGLEALLQLRPQLFVVMQEGRGVGPTHRPRDLPAGQAQALHGALELSNEGQIGNRAVVGADGHWHAGAQEPGQGSVRVGAADPGLQVAGGADVEASRRARVSSRMSAGSSAAGAPWAIRQGSISSARQTCAAPPHSPAWQVMPSPAARAAPMAAPKTRGSGASRSMPAMSKPVRPSLRKVARGVRHLRGHGRVVRAQRDRDEAHVDAGAAARLAGRPGSRPRCRRASESPRSRCSEGAQRISA